MDSTGKSASRRPAASTSSTRPIRPIRSTRVVTLPKFTLNGNTYSLNLSTTLADGVTSRYTLVVGGKSYLFGPDNAHVTVDRTDVHLQPASRAASYTVGYASLDQPAGDQAPSPIPLTPFSIAMGGAVATIDVFNNPGALNNIVLGVIGRQYSYDPVHGQVTIHDGASTTTVPLADRPHVRLEQRLRLRDRLHRRHLHRERHADVPVLGVDHGHASDARADDGAADVHARRQFLHLRPGPDRRVRQRHWEPADVPGQPVPVLAQRRRSTSSTPTSSRTR